jgi:hypothetical protein
MDGTVSLEKGSDGIYNIPLLADYPADIGIGDFEIYYTCLNIDL